MISQKIEKSDVLKLCYRLLKIPTLVDSERGLILIVASQEKHTQVHLRILKGIVERHFEPI